MNWNIIAETMREQFVFLWRTITHFLSYVVQTFLGGTKTQESKDKADVAKSAREQAICVE